MKIGLFTDPHYSSQEITCGVRYNSRSLEKIKRAYARFEAERCELVICLGDLTDTEDSHEKELENLRSIAEVIAASPIRTVCVMGNHDAFAFEEAEFYKILGGCQPEPISADGKTLLFLDACYFKSGVHYRPGDTDWTDTFYPHTDALKQQIDAAEGEVCIFLHQNIDPDVREDHRLYNAPEINGILRESQKVTAVYQGHYHPGMNSKHGDIAYYTFPAMCERENACFILEI